MVFQNTPYVYGRIDDDYDDAPVDDAPDGSDETVIVDGRVMSYRRYRRHRGG